MKGEVVKRVGNSNRIKGGGLKCTIFIETFFRFLMNSSKRYHDYLLVFLEKIKSRLAINKNAHWTNS